MAGPKNQTGATGFGNMNQGNAQNSNQLVQRSGLAGSSSSMSEPVPRPLPSNIPKRTGKIQAANLTGQTQKAPARRPLPIKQTAATGRQVQQGLGNQLFSQESISQMQRQPVFSEVNTVPQGISQSQQPSISQWKPLTLDDAREVSVITSEGFIYGLLPGSNVFLRESNDAQLIPDHIQIFLTDKTIFQGEDDFYGGNERRAIDPAENLVLICPRKNLYVKPWEEMILTKNVSVRTTGIGIFELKQGTKVYIKRTENADIYENFTQFFLLEKTPFKIGKWGRDGNGAWYRMQKEIEPSWKNFLICPENELSLNTLINDSVKPLNLKTEEAMLEPKLKNADERSLQPEWEELRLPPNTSVYYNGEERRLINQIQAYSTSAPITEHNCPEGWKPMGIKVGSKLSTRNWKKSLQWEEKTWDFNCLKYTVLYCPHKGFATEKEIDEKLTHFPRISDPNRSPIFHNLVRELLRNKVEYYPLGDEEHPVNKRTENIVDRTPKGDKTYGSCASLAFAYAGTKAGFDVHSFRGGRSLVWFSSNYSKVFELPELRREVIKYSSNSDSIIINQVMSYLQNHPMEEYILIVGSHAAIVKAAPEKQNVKDKGSAHRERKTSYECFYLELQGYNNGWKSFYPDEGTLVTTRFNTSNANPQMVRNGYLISVDALKNSYEFLLLLGFLNTPEKLQQAGTGGGEK